VKITPTTDFRNTTQEKFVAYGWVISILTIWFFTASRF